MKYTRFFQKPALIILVFATYITEASAKSWIRHIYNKTDAPWYFHIKSELGNFYAHCKYDCKHGTDTYENKNFIVDSNETWEIKMTHDGHRTNSRIINQYGMSATYCFEGNSSAIRSKDIYVTHNGETGGVSLNTPANADIKLNDTNLPPIGSSPCP